MSLALLLGLMLSASLSAQDAKRPNIIFILTDQMPDKVKSLSRTWQQLTDRFIAERQGRDRSPSGP